MKTREEAERKARAARGQAGRRRDQPEDAKAKAEEAAAKEPPGKEITKGYRWVAVTGVLDHAKMLANYREALKNPAVAHPNYKRLDVQRKTLQPDGTWSEWENGELEREPAKSSTISRRRMRSSRPSHVRPEALVDPLPFLKAGLWEKVHIASLVPLEKKKIPEDDAARGHDGRWHDERRHDGRHDGRWHDGRWHERRHDGRRHAGRRHECGGMMGGMMGGGMQGGGMMGGMTGGGMKGGMMGGGMMGGATETAGNYWRSDEKRVMIRALDFTVQPDTTYRYRVRIVVFNPNNNREDVSPGVDTKAEELRGKWSDPTDEVQMPPDVMPYVKGTLPPSPASDVKVQFQVIRFNPADGVTVPRSFDAAPGEVIGEPRTADIPVSDGSGKKSKTIDFNSHQIVLDVYVNKKIVGKPAAATGICRSPHRSACPRPPPPA